MAMRLSEPAKTSFSVLPPELRNRVYHYVAVSEEPIRIKLRTRNNAHNQDHGGRCFSPSPPGLAFTSKQIHHELLTIYYSENDFHVALLRDEFHGLHKWAMTLRTFAGCLTSVRTYGYRLYNSPDNQPGSLNIIDMITTTLTIGADGKLKAKREDLLDLDHQERCVCDLLALDTATRVGAGQGLKLLRAAALEANLHRASVKNGICEQCSFQMQEVVEDSQEYNAYVCVRRTALAKLPESQWCAR